MQFPPFNSGILFSDRVAVGRALDLPVYFGDAGSREVCIIVRNSIISLSKPRSNDLLIFARYCTKLELRGHVLLPLL